MESHAKVKVKVLENFPISPPPGSVSPSSLPLTYFDLRSLARHPVHLLFFYQFHLSKPHFVNTILPNLKLSLSLTLQHYYPLAGNLVWPQQSSKPQLVYKEGDAVYLTVAESDYDLHQLSGSHAQDLTHFYPLLPKLISIQEVVPSLALQVTLFPNQGICVGVNLTHPVCDGWSITNFIKSWASICRSGDAAVVADSPPFFDRSTLKYLRPREAIQLTEFEKLNVTRETLHSLLTLNNEGVIPVGTLQSTFVMNRFNIARLKQWISARLDAMAMSTEVHLSSFVVTCAYVWVCWVRARAGGSHASEAIERFIIPVDVRARLDPPLPPTYFGTCVESMEVITGRSDLIAENGIVVAANLIGKAIQEFDIQAETGKYVTYFASLPPEHCLVVTSSPKFRNYETDFGWGKPKKVNIHSIHNMGNIFLIEYPNEEGALEIGLLCKRNEMEAFTSLFCRSLPFPPM